MIFSKYQVLFYCSSYIDEIWIRTTIIYLCRFKVKICLIILGDTPVEILDIYENLPIRVQVIVDPRKLNKVHIEILVSLSTGIEREKFSKKIKYFVHMPHSLVSLHGVYPNNAFDAFNVLFASGEHHVKEFQELTKIRKVKNAKIFETGYGKFDILMNTVGNLESKKNHVLIAPSWGDGNIIETVGLDVIQKLLELDFKVTLRPHCMFYYAKKKYLEPFFSIVDPRFMIEGFSDSISLTASDMLITDYSGIAFEYYFIKKRKIIFVNTTPKIINQDYEKFKCDLVEIQKRDSMGMVVPCNVDEIIDSVKSKFEINQNLGNDFVYNINKCGSVASHQIMELLSC